MAKKTEYARIKSIMAKLDNELKKKAVDEKKTKGKSEQKETE